MLAGLAVALVVGWQVAPALVGVFYDDGIYLGLARALVSGDGYRLPWLPLAPPGVHYPPGYPVFLAGLWTLWPTFPANVALFKGANALLMGVFAACTVRHLAARLPLRPVVLAVLVVVTATSVPTVAVATVLFAEPLFLVLAALACWAADASADAAGRRAIGLAVAAGLLAGAATLTRSIGVAVVAGAAGALVWRRRPAAAAILAACAVALAAPWMMWSSRHAGEVPVVLAANYGTYGQFLGQGGTSWWSLASLAELTRPLAAIAVPRLPAGLTWVVLAALLALLAWGLVRLALHAPALGLTLVAYLGVVALWPYGPERFVWAALPWLAAAAACGARDLLARTRDAGAPGPRALRAGVMATAAVVLATMSWGQAHGYLRGAPTATQRGISATFEMVLPWVLAQTDSTSVVAGEDEALLWLYTGRRAVPTYLWKVRGRGGDSFGPDSLRAFLDRSGATHLLLTGPGSEAAGDVDGLLERFPGYLRLVQVWPGGVFGFRIERGG